MKKIILDCDPGMDDSVAIIMAVKSTELNLLAVTTLNGNYPSDITSVNALKVVEMLGATNIPVAKGMSSPMTRKTPKDPFSHGKDGQGENFLPTPKTQLSKLHAVDLIIKLVKENPNEITIIATGPLSNVAMAIQKEPEIKSLIKEIVAISGTFGLNEYSYANATGDTPMSEWNVFVDPEAAEVVYSSGIKFTALGLDVATHFDVNFSEKTVEKFGKSPKKEAQFLYNAINFVNKRGFEAYCAVIDCMAVGYVIDNSLVEVIEGHVGIETKSNLTLGMTVYDKRHHFVWEHLPKIRIGKKADCQKFLNLIEELTLC